MASTLQNLKEQWQKVRGDSQPAGEIGKPENRQNGNGLQSRKKRQAAVVPNASKATLEQLKSLERFSSERSASGKQRNRNQKAGRVNAPAGDDAAKDNPDKEAQAVVSSARSEGAQGAKAAEKENGRMAAGQTARREKSEQKNAEASAVLQKGKGREPQGKGIRKAPKEAADAAKRRPAVKANPEEPKKPTLPVERNKPVKLEVAENLPVFAKADEIKRAITDNQVIIVCGETGSGKTTQLPKICLQLGRGREKLIGHTQPRRIAATSIAKRIAEETQTRTGEVAGFKIRFKDEMEPGASIKLMTDGILLSETQTDPLFRRYDTIIIDEAHERSLNIDFLLGYLKQILPRRPDLKVIITSATIDADRFAAHFRSVNGKDVPVINVSGRLYPVEIVYQPVEDEDDNEDRTLMHGIAEACEALMRKGPGDILVFLPGEREIREAKEILSGMRYPDVEVLPLFSRLTIEEQDKIFHASRGRRIVLSTNIAETSLTVPGIRYVVDSGLARVKRYSYKNKVEQLQIEPVSQAAAQQRAGRCGRVANGVCIRLYSEEDFNKRPAYTDPEILRSSLATVILRMKSLRLTDVEEFPFVEAPLPKAITDGYDLLIELNAVTARRGELTQVGKELARLPLDARVARILHAGAQNQALAEMLAIASAISVQDPRERPIDAQTQADQAHKKFADERSDFLAFVNMWEYTRELHKNKESNRLYERQLKSDYLSPRRVREWRDVHRQLEEMVAEFGWRVNTVKATYEQIHKSLLSGLLGNIGMRSVDPDWRTPPFTGARGTKFWPWPGSRAGKKAGKWIVSGEIVETSRLYARTIADVEPEWIEAVGSHLIRKSWSEPHWEKSRGKVIAFEKGTLYGLPVYGQRKVGFEDKDPAASREIFIRSALVEGDFESQAPFWQHNTALINSIKEMEHKSRRPDVLVDDESIYAFYDKILGKEVCGADTLEKWRRENEAGNPRILFMTRSLLMMHDASGITVDYFPKKLEVSGVPMALDYNFDPGSPRDGVTLTVPLFALNQIDEQRMEWLVPGMIKEKAHALVKSLPQKLRRCFVPLPEWSKSFAMSHEKPSGDLLEAIMREAEDSFGIKILKTDFKLEQLAPHLFMNYKVVDEHGRQLAMSRSLPQLRSELSTQARADFQKIATADAKVAEDLQDRISDWTIGDLPEIMEINRKGMSLIGHPALVDKGEYCALEVFDDPQRAQELHYLGLRRLIRIKLAEQIKYLDKNLKSLQSAQMIGSSLSFAKTAFADFDELKKQVIDACIDQIALSEELPSTEEDFRRVCLATKEKLNLLGNEVASIVAEIMRQASAVNQKLNLLKGFKEVREDIDEQLADLFRKGFVESVPISILRHYPRYLKAIAVRLDKLRNASERDAERMEQIRKLKTQLSRELAARKGVRDPKLEEFKNLLEELRVSLFAQELKTPMPVSVKRLSKIWESIPKLRK